MKIQRLLIVFTLVNLTLLIFMLAAMRPASANGVTVLLRLITERGRPSVKISTSEEAAGLALVGLTGTKATYVLIEAKGTASTLTLKNENGREQVVKP